MTMGSRRAALLRHALDGLEAGPIVVATHPRSGTHLAMDALRWRAPACRVAKLPFERLDHLYLNIDALMQIRDRINLPRALLTLVRAKRPLIKTHTMAGFRRWYLPDRHEDLDPVWRDWLDRRGQVVHVYRDGRASVWSYYLLTRRAGAATDMTFPDFLRSRSDASVGLGAAEGWSRHVRSWLARADTLSVSFEAMVREPESVLTRLGRHLALEFEPRVPALPRPFKTVGGYRLGRLPGGHPESTAILAPDPISPARRWRDVFTREDGRVFEEATDGLLVELGYEHSRDWWRDLRR